CFFFLCFWFFSVFIFRPGGPAPRPPGPAGQVAVVAYLLGDTDLLTELDETDTTVLSRYAADLFGFVGGRKDNEKGLVDTQAWFDSVRKALG
ncbi:hypothetical protein ACWDYD_20495, partial [Nocardia sp. NPDC003054]